MFVCKIRISTKQEERRYNIVKGNDIVMIDFNHVRTSS